MSFLFWNVTKIMKGKSADESFAIDVAQIYDDDLWRSHYVRLHYLRFTYWRWIISVDYFGMLVLVLHQDDDGDVCNRDFREFIID